MRFTDRAIQGLKPKEQRYEVWETNRNGFGLRVSPKGRKSWIFFYRFNGKTRRMTLGVYPAKSLADAHAAHADAKQMLDRNIDPGQVEQEGKHARRVAPTVANLADEYLEKWAKPRKRSWKEDERMLTKYVVPVWGERKVRDISKREARLLVGDIASRGAGIQANRVLALVRKMFNFAVEEDIILINPCRNLTPPAKERRKDRVLSEEEIRIFWKTLESTSMSEQPKDALKLILITGQRPGEVIGAKWDEIEGEWWTIPSERAKNKMPHRVYITDLAFDIIGESGEGYLFPSPRASQPVHVNALAHAVRRNSDTFGLEPFTPHDLRRTAASHMTANGVTRLTISKILNHAESGVTATYDRHSYDQEKRKALSLWSRKLGNLIGKRQDEKVMYLNK